MKQQTEQESVLSRLKRNPAKASDFLSDQLVITRLDVRTNPVTHPGHINGFAAVLATAGRFDISINADTYSVEAGSMVIFHPNCTVCVTGAAPDTDVYLAAITRPFLNNMSIDMGITLPWYLSVRRHPVIALHDGDRQIVRDMLHSMLGVVHSGESPYRVEILGCMATAFIYKLIGIYQQEKLMDTRGRHSNKELLFEQFVELLLAHYRSERSLGFYARRLGISSKYLSLVIKTVSGKSAVEWIDDYVIQEAKNLLLRSGLSIGEVAARLNFSTQSFFGKYFKLHTGISPKKFQTLGK